MNLPDKYFAQNMLTNVSNQDMKMSALGQKQTSISAVNVSAFASMMKTQFAPLLRPPSIEFPSPRTQTLSMHAKPTTVAAYLASLPPDRRGPIVALRAVILQNLQPGFQEAINWGMICYEVPLADFVAAFRARYMKK
jgi:hypothetical protein